MSDIEVKIRVCVFVEDEGALRTYAAEVSPGLERADLPQLVLGALITDNENPPLADYGLELTAISSRRTDQRDYELKAEFTITDKQAVYAFARGRYAAAWMDADWQPEDPATAVLEAVVLSNDNPSPADYGITITDYAASC